MHTQQLYALPFFLVSEEFLVGIPDCNRRCFAVAAMDPRQHSNVWSGMLRPEKYIGDKSCIGGTFPHGIHDLWWRGYRLGRELYDHPATCLGLHLRCPILHYIPDEVAGRCEDVVGEAFLRRGRAAE